MSRGEIPPALYVPDIRNEGVAWGFERITKLLRPGRATPPPEIDEEDEDNDDEVLLLSDSFCGVSRGRGGTDAWRGATDAGGVHSGCAS